MRVECWEGEQWDRLFRKPNTVVSLERNFRHFQQITLTSRTVTACFVNCKPSTPPQPPSPTK